jgi:hypothetical protein
MKTSFALLLLLASALCASMQAQELDIYDIDDFVDPRQLGAVVGPYGRLTCPCDRFLVSRLMGGGVANYIDVFRPTAADATFIHLATSYYRGPWQANWKLTRLSREDFLSDERPIRETDITRTPQHKSTLQLARYLAFGPAASATVIRMEATWTALQYQHRAIDPATGGVEVDRRYEHEVGFEGDIPWRIGGLPLITSLVYVGRFRPANEVNTLAHRRVTLLQRAPRLSVGRWSLDTAVAVGSVNADGNWSDLMVQPSLHVVSPTIPGVNMRVNIRYAPAFGGLAPPPRGQQRQSPNTNQFAIFIDRAMFANRFHSSGE